jgi:rRNA-processing protein FCF1
MGRLHGLRGTPAEHAREARRLSKIALVQLKRTKSSRACAVAFNALASAERAYQEAVWTKDKGLHKRTRQLVAQAKKKSMRCGK